MNDLYGMLALGDESPRLDDLVPMAEALGGMSAPAAVVDDRCGLAIMPRSRTSEETGGLLSIPTEHGEQTISIAFDGHAYNHQEVRAALRAVGVAFQTDAAAETILQSYRRFGVLNFIKAFRGPFAFAIWDSIAQRLLLARDRLGQKPLYTAQTAHCLLFASSIKALLAHPDLHAELNMSVVPRYLAYGYPPEPDTLFSGVQILPPGHILLAERSGADFNLTQEVYWQPFNSSSGSDPRSDQNIATDLLAHLRGAIRLRVDDNQPPGAVLNGRMDSAAVLALLTEETGRQVMTFSLSLNPKADFEERRFVRKVAAHFVSDHTDLAIEPNIATMLDDLLAAFDQPFGDAAALPVYLLSKEAGTTLPILFSGDGGNELCGGYANMQLARLARSYDHLPEVAQRAITEVMERLPETLAYAGFMRQANTIVKAADQSLADRYLSWVRLTPGPWLAALMGGQREQTVNEHFRSLFVEASGHDEADVVATLLDVNLRTALPANLLTRLDRVGRATGVDTRLPFLDHVVINYVAAIPSKLKLRPGTSNTILKHALRDSLPASILDRKPQGMTLPVDEWFRGELAGFAQDALTGPGAYSRDIFDTVALTAMLDTHITGEVDLGFALWTLLTFELWLRRTF